MINSELYLTILSACTEANGESEDFLINVQSDDKTIIVQGNKEIVDEIELEAWTDRLVIENNL